jgi:hypothetical protein
MAAFSRRRLVQALGLGAGSALLAPLLRQVQAGENTPRRFVFVVEGNGVYPYSFLSTKARAAIDQQATQPVGDERLCYRRYGHTSPIEVPGDSLATALCLDPLAASAGKISLETRAAVVLGLSSTVTGGGHSTGFGALSCARAVSSPAIASIDTALAALVKQQTAFDALRLGTNANRSARLSYETCAFGPGKPAPILVDPAVAYASVFGSVGDASSLTAFTEQQALLDFTRGDVQRALKAFGGSSVERQKLERYLEGVESLQTRQQKLVAAKDALTKLRPEAPSTNPLYQQGSLPQDGRYLDLLAAQFQIATASLLGNLTNVVVLASGTGSSFDVFDRTINKDLARHNMQHGMLPKDGASASDLAFSAGCVTDVAAVTRRHVSLLADMARQLAATPEPGASGSMLDHTLIVYLSDNGEQHHSVAEEWPILLVGGNALGFKTDGRTVVYPAVNQPNNRQVSNLYNSLGHAAGQDAFNTFGLEGSSRIAEGPLSEIWAPV